jgi:hypothetical protein
MPSAARTGAVSDARNGHRVPPTGVWKDRHLADAGIDVELREVPLRFLDLGASDVLRSHSVRVDPLERSTNTRMCSRSGLGA